MVRNDPRHAWSAQLWVAFLADVPSSEIGLPECTLAMDALWLPALDRGCPDCRPSA